MTATVDLDGLRVAAARAFAGSPAVVVYLFGSMARRLANRSTEEPHDLDIAVLCLGRPYDLLDLLGRCGALERASGVGPADLVVLDDAPLALADRVLRDRLVLYSADEPARVRYEDETSRMAHDFAYSAEPLDRDILATRAARAR